MTHALLKLAILAFMQSRVPYSHHAYYEVEERTRARYNEFADALVDVALDESTSLAFDGDPLQNALVWANVAAEESYFRGDVMRCKVPGRGSAWGPYQFQRMKSEACAGFRESTRYLADWIKRAFFVCIREEPEDKLSWFTDGRCEANSSRSRMRVLPAMRYWQRAPLAVCWGS